MSLNNPGYYNGESMVINPVFSGVVQSLKPSDFGLAHDAMFPDVKFKSAGNGMGTYMRYNLSDNLREVDEELLIRRPATPAFAISRPRSYEVFKVQRRQLDAAVNEEDAMMIKDQTNGADDPHVTEVQWVREVMLLAKERRAAKFAATVANVGTNVAPGIAWDQAGSDPIADLVNLRLTVKAKCGIFPDRLAMPYEVALRLSQNANIRALRGNAERKAANQNELAELLKDILALKEVTLFTAMYNTVKPSATPTTSLLSIWGPNVYMYSRPETIGFTSLCWGFEAMDTFYGGDFNSPAYTIPLPDSEVMKYRIKEDSDFILMNKEVAGAIRNVVTLPTAP
jgi:hypothetical protein